MPAVIVHDTFALEMIPEDEKPYIAAVRSGTQGPDLFMAYGKNPFKKREDAKEIRPWGTVMHHTPVEDVYGKMMEYANTKEAGEKELLYAYIDGLLMHFSVDRVCHPYVFYRTGFDEKGGISGSFGWWHGYFEACLDKEFGSRKGTFIRPDKAMGNLDLDSVQKIGKMWRECAPFPLKDNSYEISYKDYNDVTRMMWSPTGIKRFFVKLFMKKSSQAYSMIYPASRKEANRFDVCNDAHATWKDPCTGEEKTASFEELFEKSKEGYRAVHEILLKAKKGEDVYAELKQWADNLDHDGNPYGMEKRYSDPVSNYVK